MTDDRHPSDPARQAPRRVRPRGQGILWIFAGLGAAMIVLAGVADLIGIGEPGFGERQLALTVVGALLLAGAALGSLRSSPRQAERAAGRSAYATFAVILLNTALAFIVLNVAAAVWLRLSPARTARADAISSPLLRIPLAGLVHQWGQSLSPSEGEALRLDPRQRALIYPGWSRVQLTALLHETHERPLQFDPLTQFREAPFTGRFVNVSKAGFRAGPEPPPWPMPTSDYNIWVLGGSTTFGYGLPDSQTIPAQLESILRARHPGTRLHVYNFGQAYFYSRQELALLEELLVSSPTAPQLAVFIDGINEHQEMPFYTGYIRGLLQNPLRAVLQSPRGQSLPGGKAIVERWLRVKQLEEGVCARFGVLPLFVWQPAPNWGYDLKYHVLWRSAGEPMPSVADHYAFLSNLIGHDPGRLGTDFLWLGRSPESSPAAAVCRQDPLHRRALGGDSARDWQGFGAASPETINFLS